jgi:hypothetical protein
LNDIDIQFAPRTDGHAFVPSSPVQRPAKNRAAVLADAACPIQPVHEFRANRSSAGAVKHVEEAVAIGLNESFRTPPTAR